MTTRPASGLNAVTPIGDESDETLERYLAHASVPALLMSVVHMSGDFSLLDGPIRPKKTAINEYHGHLSDAEQAEARKLALAAVKAYRDRGCTLPPPPDAQQVRRMMSFVAGEPVPEETVPLMLEELALDGVDLRAPQWQREVDPAQLEDFHVMIVGAGMSGLLQAMRLRDAGIAFTVIEKNDSVGGTWYENKYPGCRVDIANHFYSYSFDSDQPWSEYFCRRDELLAYFRSFAERHGLMPHIRFNTEVVAARYDDTEARWSVQLRDNEGREEHLHVNALVSAVGQLNRPNIPSLRGQQKFTGPQVHTARWDETLDLRGKRVAVIGSGASAFQLVPAIADQVEQLYVFQRSAPWMIPNPIYHEAVTAEFRWLVEHLPYYGRWFRFLVFWPGSDGTLPALRIDPEWPHQDRSVNAINEQMREGLMAWMQHQVGDDAELLEKVTPRYPPMGKRIMQDNGSWLQALKKPNVELITEGVEELDETGVRGLDRHYDVDVILYATGFHANRFLAPMEIIGSGGTRLHAMWGEEPGAYLGITIPGFPNLFCLYGPSTNLAHAGSIIFHAECQVRYVTACLQRLVERGARAMDCTAEAYDDYQQRLRQELASLVWSHPACDSWYRNSAGLVVTTSPWRLTDYWTWTREPDLRDYRLIS